MKRIAKTLLIRSVRALPRGAKYAILDELTNYPWAFEAAGKFAIKAGLRGFVAEGECGVIRGALDDDAALARYASDGVWSPRQTALLKELLAGHGGTYLDVGANIGLTLIPIARDHRVTCHAFEPDPANFRYLRENVAVNCDACNVALYNIALYDREARLPFELAERHSGDHRISLTDAEGELGEHLRRKVQVSTKRLDDVLAAWSDPLVVKMDVQGSEPFVIAGGRNTLSQASLLCMEFWPYSMRRMEGDVGAVIAFVAEHFEEGSISPGDKNAPINWQSIDAVASFLEKFARSATTLEYLDVVVRKV